MRYTWAQFRSYLRLARRRRAEERVLAFVGTNLALNGGDAATKFLKTLQADAGDADEAED